MINKYFEIVVFALSLLFAASCSNEMEITGGENAPGANDEFVSLSLTIPVTDVPSTKGLTVEDLLQGENRINFLYVEFFQRKEDGSDEIISTWNSGEPPQFTSTPNGDIKTLIRVPVYAYKLWPSHNGGGAYIRVFANYTKAPGILKNEDELWTWPLVEPRPLFMSGLGILSDTGLAGGVGKYESEVTLARQLAKVRVKLGVSKDAVPANLQIDYDQVKVQILNAANYSDWLESRDVSSTPGFGYINYPERTGSALRMKKENGIYEAGEVIDSSYIHENIRDSYDEKTTTSLRITIPSTDPATGFKETHTQLIKITGDDGYRLKRNHVYTLDLRLRSQKGIDIMQKITDWWDKEVAQEVLDSSYIYTSGPLLLTPSMEAGDISFESSHPVQIDLSGITADMNIEGTTVYKPGSNRTGYIRFKWTNPPVESFSFDVTITSEKLQRRIKVTYNHS